jgi:hypothetical protein
MFPRGRIVYTPCAVSFQDDIRRIVGPLDRARVVFPGPGVPWHVPDQYLGLG